MELVYLKLECNDRPRCNTSFEKATAVNSGAREEREFYPALVGAPGVCFSLWGMCMIISPFFPTTKLHFLCPFAAADVILLQGNSKANRRDEYRKRLLVTID